MIAMVNWARFQLTIVPLKFWLPLIGIVWLRACSLAEEVWRTISVSVDSAALHDCVVAQGSVSKRSEVNSNEISAVWRSTVTDMTVMWAWSTREWQPTMLRGTWRGCGECRWCIIWHISWHNCTPWAIKRATLFSIIAPVFLDRFLILFMPVEREWIRHNILLMAWWHNIIIWWIKIYIISASDHTLQMFTS